MTLLDCHPCHDLQLSHFVQDVEGTVIRANFGSGSTTQGRIENAGTKAADLAESDMSPLQVVRACMHPPSELHSALSLDQEIHGPLHAHSCIG